MRGWAGIGPALSKLPHKQDLIGAEKGRKDRVEAAGTQARFVRSEGQGRRSCWSGVGTPGKGREADVTTTFSYTNKRFVRSAKGIGVQGFIA